MDVEKCKKANCKHLLFYPKNLSKSWCWACPANAKHREIEKLEKCPIDNVRGDCGIKYKKEQ